MKRSNVYTNRKKSALNWFSYLGFLMLIYCKTVWGIPVKAFRENLPVHAYQNEGKTHKSSSKIPTSTQNIWILFIFVKVDLCKLTLFLQSYVNLVLVHHLCYKRCWKNLMRNWVPKNIMFGHCIKTLRETRSQPKREIALFLLEERNWLMKYTLCIKKCWMEERKECWSYWKKWTYVIVSI